LGPNTTWVPQGVLESLGTTSFGIILVPTKTKVKESNKLKNITNMLKAIKKKFGLGEYKTLEVYIYRGNISGLKLVIPKLDANIGVSKGTSMVVCAERVADSIVALKAYSDFENSELKLVYSDSLANSVKSKLKVLIEKKSQRGFLDYNNPINTKLSLANKKAISDMLRLGIG